MPRPSASTPLIPTPDRRAGSPLYLQLAATIEDCLRDGSLRAGERLPSERRLATQLGVSRITVTTAYKELEARGLLRGDVGRGTMVVAAPGEEVQAIPWAERAIRYGPEVRHLLGRVIGRMNSSGPEAISFVIGWPDPALCPRRALGGIAASVVKEAALSLSALSPVAGDPALRETVAWWLRTQGLDVRAEDVLITHGAQGGINLVARAFVGPGDVVVTESPTYVNAAIAFRWTGARVVGVPMDAHGMCCDLLEEAFHRHRPKLLYLIPNFNHGTGAVLDLERRRRVLKLAARYRVAIFESDVYGQLYFDVPPPPPLRALDDDGLVVYQGSFSKMGAPGLRVGWLVAPRRALEALVAATWIGELATSTISQRVVEAFLRGGHLETHLVGLRRELRARRDAMVAALRTWCPTVTFDVPAGGYYLWAQLPPALRARAVRAAAATRGVALCPGAIFMPNGGGHGSLRFSFSALTPATITEGIRRTGDAIREVTIDR
jgi:2-aminoadipate transaminase